MRNLLFIYLYMYILPSYSTRYALSYLINTKKVIKRVLTTDLLHISTRNPVFRWTQSRIVIRCHGHTISPRAVNNQSVGGAWCRKLAFLVELVSLSMLGSFGSSQKSPQFRLCVISYLSKEVCRFANRSYNVKGTHGCIVWSSQLDVLVCVIETWTN